MAKTLIKTLIMTMIVTCLQILPAHGEDGCGFGRYKEPPKWEYRDGSFYDEFGNQIGDLEDHERWRIEKGKCSSMQWEIGEFSDDGFLSGRWIEILGDLEGKYASGSKKGILRIGCWNKKWLIFVAGPNDGYRSIHARFDGGKIISYSLSLGQTGQGLFADHGGYINNTTSFLSKLKTAKTSVTLKIYNKDTEYVRVFPIANFTKAVKELTKLKCSLPK